MNPCRAWNCAELWPSKTGVRNYCIISLPLLWFPQTNIVHPFSLSYHPFAMLSSFKAVDRARKHSEFCLWHCALTIQCHFWYVFVTKTCLCLPAQMLKRWNTLRNKETLAALERQKASSPTPSSLTSLSVSHNTNHFFFPLDIFIYKALTIPYITCYHLMIHLNPLLFIYLLWIIQ